MKLQPSLPGIAAILLAAVAMPMSASADTEPDFFDLGWIFGAHRGALAYSNLVTVTGIDEPVIVEIARTTAEDAGISIGCTQTFTDQSVTIVNGQSFCVRHRVGYTHDITDMRVGSYPFGAMFKTTTIPDQLPAPAGFPMAYGAPVGGTIVAGPVIVTDIADGRGYPSETTIDPGPALRYSIGCTGSWSIFAGTIRDGETVCVQTTAASVPDTLTYRTLQVGEARWVFANYTGAALAGVPSPFAFTPSIGVRRGYGPRGSTTITGLSSPAAVSVSGGFYATPRQTDTDVPGFVFDNDLLTLSHVAPKQFGATTATTVNVGGIAAAFTSRTIDRKVLTSGRLQDFNGDGYADMLWRNDASGDARLWLLDDYYPNANGLQREIDLLRGRLDWTPTHTGDLDGDGTSDVVWRNDGTGETALWLMSEGMYLRGAVVVIDPAWEVTHVGDFDGDGTSDLLWHNATDGRTILWLVDGLAFHAWAVLLQHADWKVQHTGDFDGDGKADLLWRNRATGETAMWLMDGPKMRSGAIVQANGAWNVELVGDLDGDGRDDLVWSGPNQEVALYLMDGTLRRAGARLPAGTGSPVAMADFDADGKADLLIRTTQGIERYRMDGLAVLGTALELDLAKTMLRATDFNGDGRADIAYADPAATPAGIHLRYTPSLLPVTGPNPQPVQADPTWKLQ